MKLQNEAKYLNVKKERRESFFMVHYLCASFINFLLLLCLCLCTRASISEKESLKNSTSSFFVWISSSLLTNIIFYYIKRPHIGLKIDMFEGGKLNREFSGEQKNLSMKEFIIFWYHMFSQHLPRKKKFERICQKKTTEYSNF